MPLNPSLIAKSIQLQVPAFNKNFKKYLTQKKIKKKKKKTTTITAKCTSWPLWYKEMIH